MIRFNPSSPINLQILQNPFSTSSLWSIVSEMSLKHNNVESLKGSEHTLYWLHVFVTFGLISNRLQSILLCVCLTCVVMVTTFLRLTVVIRHGDQPAAWAGFTAGVVPRVIHVETPNGDECSLQLPVTWSWTPQQVPPQRPVADSRAHFGLYCWTLLCGCLRICTELKHIDNPNTNDMVRETPVKHRVNMSSDFTATPRAFLGPHEATDTIWRVTAIVT